MSSEDEIYDHKPPDSKVERKIADRDESTSLFVEVTEGDEKIPFSALINYTSENNNYYFNISGILQNEINWKSCRFLKGCSLFTFILSLVYLNSLLFCLLVYYFVYCLLFCL